MKQPPSQQGAMALVPDPNNLSSAVSFSDIISEPSWNEAWVRFLESNPDMLPNAASWGSFTHLQGMASPKMPPAAAAVGGGGPGTTIPAAPAQPALPTSAATSAGPPLFASSPIGAVQRQRASQISKRKAEATGGVEKRQRRTEQPSSSGEVPTELVVPLPEQQLEELELTLPGCDIVAKLMLGELLRMARPSVCRDGERLHLKLMDKPLLDSQAVLYKVDLRGGRVKWVTRKQLQTILRNRRSAAACRDTALDLKGEVERLRSELKKKDAQLLATQRMLRNVQAATAGSSTGFLFLPGMPPPSPRDAPPPLRAVVKEGKGRPCGSPRPVLTRSNSGNSCAADSGNSCAAMMLPTS